MSSQKHPGQISSGPRRLEPSWSADIPGHAHLQPLQPSHAFRLTPGHTWSIDTSDTGGEFIFVGCQPTNKPGFQAPAEHELC
jgi:hypothetical protein